MNCLALDPGKRTGWCYGVLDQTRNVLVLEPNEDELSLSAVYEKLSKFIECGGEHIIYEDFQYRNFSRAGLDLTPVKVQGVIELFREWHEPFISFTCQSPATGKAFYSDDRLKSLGVYWGHGKGHARDATRHLLQWAGFGAGSVHLDLVNTPMELIGGDAK